jgi:prepilin-type N-terminal cleavage/methylation domain-containing protein
MNRRGFTIVELIIVITIMGILLVLGVVSLRSTQANARDESRKGDVDTLSQALEIFYKTGNDASTTVGEYPTTSQFSADPTVGGAIIVLRDISPSALISPSAPSLSPIATSTSSLIPATTNNATTTTITPMPSSSTDSYIYQPLQSDGTLCTLAIQECRKFNIYYWREVDNTVQMVTSKNQ